MDLRRTSPRTKLTRRDQDPERGANLPTKTQGGGNNSGRRGSRTHQFLLNNLPVTPLPTATWTAMLLKWKCTKMTTTVVMSQTTSQELKCWKCFKKETEKARRWNWSS
jgi:hypothetical protein